MRAGIYTVGFRVSSSAHLCCSSQIVVEDFPGPHNPLTVAFRTTFSRRWFALPSPGDLLIEVRGEAPTIRSAAESFAQPAASVAALLAVTANAAFGEPELTIAFEDSRRNGQWKSLQTVPANTAARTYTCRQIDAQSAAAIFEAVERADCRADFLSAARSYQTALLHWRSGHRLRSLAELYRGLEALTYPTVLLLCDQRNCSQAVLAYQMCVSRSDLALSVLRESLFEGDVKAFSTAVSAVCALECSETTGPEFDEELHHTVARYLRWRFLNLLGIDDGIRSTLTLPPFDQPLPNPSAGEPAWKERLTQVDSA